MTFEDKNERRKVLMSETHTKKVAVVFGGAGFLGSHVADELSRSGFRVRLFDQKESRWLREDQEMVIGDILNDHDVDASLDGAEVVYNFAAVADLNEAFSKPLQTMSVNVLGNSNLLEASVRRGVRRFVYASTVYVNSREGGFYRISKQASEQMVEEYQNLFGLDYTILRYGSIYGPRSDNHNGLYRIVRSAIDTGIVRYEGHVDSLREYIHVADVARASVAALDDEFKNEHLVLTGHERMRVHDMLMMLAEIMGLNGKVEFIDAPYKGHYVRTPYAYQPNLGRKYIPALHVDLGQGLVQLVEELHNEIKIN